MHATRHTTPIPLLFGRSMLALVLSMLIALPLRAAAGGRPFTFDDLMAIRRLGDPQISPDGRWVAFTVTTADKAKNTRNTDIWLLPTAGGEPRPLTTHPAAEVRPRWSPDGTRLAFVSTREARNSIPHAGREGRISDVGPVPLPNAAQTVYYYRRRAAHEAMAVSRHRSRACALSETLHFPEDDRVRPRRPPEAPPRFEKGVGRQYGSGEHRHTVARPAPRTAESHDARTTEGYSHHIRRKGARGNPAEPLPILTAAGGCIGRSCGGAEGVGAASG